ncbi:MAG: ribonucleoside-diphosphate reductase subunit alpha, partial [Alcanivoracaceae bacterium]|nr:ribonucleoside-diphosphate reductase subunit alpha [Alcanivoracaceae bacterium]
MQQTDTQGSKTQEHQVITDDMLNAIKTTAPGEYRVIRRNGKITGFDQSKISVAMTKAFLAVEGGQAAASTRIREKVEKLTQDVMNGLLRRLEDGGTIHIEDIQDQVELALMRSGEHKVARDYVLYRAQQAEKRAKIEAKNKKKSTAPKIYVIAKDGSKTLLDEKRLIAIISEASDGLIGVEKELILKQAYRNIFDGIAEKDLSSAIVMCARQYIEKDPNYSKAAARLLLDGLRAEVLSFLFERNTVATQAEMAKLYPQSFKKYIHKASDLELLSPELCNFDLDVLGAAIKPERDQNFTYLGFQTLYDRYFIHHQGGRIELPQNFFMRV